MPPDYRHLFERIQVQTTILSYGMGVESTAILVRWLKEPASRPCSLDRLIVLTAMTGDASSRSRVTVIWKRMASQSFQTQTSQIAYMLRATTSFPTNFALPVRSHNMRGSTPVV